MKKIAALLTAIALFFLIVGCKEENPEPGKINITFQEFVDGSPLVIDSNKYINETGNEYLITEVQYFISNLKIFYQDGEIHEIKDSDGIHYRDTDIPETRRWLISDEVPSGTIDSIVFTFGLDEETNVNGLFANPPESNMFWPDNLGGGYHYMKLNGKWLDINGMLNPFNFHIGIGQTYDTTGQVTGYVQNYFSVSTYMAIYSSFISQVKPNETAELALNMNIESWFKTPHLWNFNEWAGMMMQNQEALKAACENGYDVFTIGPVQ